MKDFLFLLALSGLLSSCAISPTEPSTPIVHEAKIVSPKRVSLTVRYPEKAKRRLTYGIGTSPQDTFKHGLEKPWTNDAMVTADLGEFENPFDQKVYIYFDVEESSNHEFLVEGNNTSNMFINPKAKIELSIGDKTYTQADMKIFVSAIGNHYALFVL